MSTGSEWREREKGRKLLYVLLLTNPEQRGQMVSPQGYFAVHCVEQLFKVGCTWAQEVLNGGFPLSQTKLVHV